jgi:hypothetical protein
VYQWLRISFQLSNFWLLTSQLFALRALWFEELFYRAGLVVNLGLAVPVGGIEQFNRSGRLVTWFEPFGYYGETVWLLWSKPL